MGTDTLETYKKKYSALMDARTSYLPSWKDATKFLLPDHGFYTDTDKAGEEKKDRYSKVIDPTADIAFNMFAAGILNGLNNPSGDWFSIQCKDPDKNKYEPFKNYFRAVEKIIYNIFMQGNYYPCTHYGYLEQGGFGIAAMLMEPSWENICQFKTCTIGEYAVSTGDDDRVDTMYREVWMTARNMAAKFGKDRLTGPVITALENNNPFMLFPVIHIMEPREGRDVTRIDVLNMKYRSVYYERDGAQDLLMESGYYYKPMAVPRWTKNGVSAYGTGRGQVILRQVKMLQEMNMSKLKAEHQMTDPATIGPSSLNKKGLNTLPGGRNWVDADKLASSKIGRLFDITYDFKGAIEGIQDVRQIIERCLYTDLFIMLIEKPNMTATEILERKEEKLFALGPAILKQTNELHEPCIEFAYETALRRGILPPAPPELEGEELKIEYVSSLAQAQKLAGMQRVKAYVQVGLDLAAVIPDAADKLDVDRIMDEVADQTGVAPQCNRTDEEVQAIREGRAQQEKQVQDAALASEQANRMKTLSQADLEGKNALTQIDEAAGG